MTRQIFFVFLLFVAAPSLVFAQPAVVPDNNTVGAVTNYVVTFTLGAADNLPNNGSITITFNQAGFTLSGTMIASSPAGVGAPNIDGGFLPATPSGSSVTFVRDGTGSALSGGLDYTIRFGSVPNTTTPGTTYNVTVTTSGTTNFTPPNFTIVVGSVSQVVIEDAAGGGGTEIGTINTDTDNDAQQFFAVGRDQFDNFVNDVSVTWSVVGGIGSVGGPATSTTLTLDTVGSGLVSADDGSGHTDVTGTITVSTGVLASIAVVEGASGDGPPFDTRSITTDQTLTLHAAGYDADGNYRSDESVTWSVTGGIGGVSPPSGTSTTFDATTAGVGTVVATHATEAPDATGNITVSAGALSRVRINTGATGNTAEVTTDVLTTGGTLTVHASGYDADGNHTGDESVSWNVTGGIGNLSSGSGISTTLTATTPGTGVIEADHATVVDDATGTITVNAGSIASIVIRDAPDNGGSAVGAVGMTADQTLTLYAASYDGAGGTGNYLGDVSVDWSAASGNLTPAISGTSTSFTFAPTTAPASGVIRATHSGSGQTDDTGTISVAVGTLSRVRINSGVSGNTGEITTPSLTADDNLTVHASGYDADGNYISDESVNWSVTGGIGTLSVSSGISTVLDATTAGTGAILADHATAIDDATGTITVSQGLLASIVLVEGAAGNGPAFDTRTVTTDQTLTLHAAGYDADGNYTGDESVTWSVTGSIGTVLPASGTSTTFDATTVNSGTVVGTHGSVGPDATGTITVNVGALSYVQVNTGASGNTSEFTTTVLTTGQILTVHASGYDDDGNFRSDESVTWDVTGGIGTLNVGSGVTTTLTASTPGDGVITADHATAIDDATGTITVVAGSIASIIIRDAPNNGGNPVGNMTITADTSVTFYAASYDGAGGTGNYLGDVSVTWSAASGDLAPPISATSASFTFSPTTAPASGIVRATHGGSGQTDDTGTITVNVGVLNRVKVLTGTTGNTGEVPDQTLVPSNTLDVHAGGFDSDDNFIGDENNVNWSVSGGIGNMNPASGTTSTFNATLPGNGRITADHPTVIDGVSGLITVAQGTVARVRIRTQPNNGGVELDIFNMTADDSLTIYAAGYDNVDNFISDVSVTWRTTPTLDATGNPVGTSFTFKPTAAPTSGQLIADHATATDDSTGTISVTPGVPVGTLTLTPTPGTLPADGLSTAAITSNQIVDADGNTVGPGREFDVQLITGPFVTFVTPDANPGRAGQQVQTVADSLNFVVQVGTQGGTQNIVVGSVDGDANGNTSITIGSLNIISVANAPDFVTRGQADVSNIQLTVQNLSPSTVTNLVPNLTFSGTGFTPTRTDGITQIPGGQTRTFTFDVAVGINATLGLIEIDGQVSGEIQSVAVAATGAATPDSFTVQTPAEIEVVSVTAPDDTVTQGDQGVSFSVIARNNAAPGQGAAAVIDSFQLQFFNNGDKSFNFPFVEVGGNPNTIAAGQQQNFDFTVNVAASADTGNYILNANAFAHDANSVTLLTSDTDGALTTDQWFVKGASNLQIVRLTPSNSSFNAGETTPWQVRMVVRNNSLDAIDLDLQDVAKTKIQFFRGATPVTSEYAITQPGALAGAGGVRLNSSATDSLVFTITQTGTTTGNITIEGRVEGTVVGVGSSISDDTNDGGKGQVDILDATASIRISDTEPATFQPAPETGSVNTSQNFSVDVEVSNQLSEPVENVDVQLTTTGGSTIASGGMDRILLIDRGGSGTATFSITAAGNENPSGETFTAQITGGTGQQTQTPANIGAAQDSTALVRIQTPAALVVAFTSLDPNQTASDTFDVEARVTNQGQSLVDSDGEVTLTLPAPYALLSVPGNTLTQTFQTGNAIKWQVIAPAIDTGPDTFRVTISDPPTEFNTGANAGLAVAEDKRAVQTLAIGLTIDSFNIIDPLGAVDDTLSTEQEFQVRATIIRSQNIDTVVATLTPPAGFAAISAVTQTLLKGQNSATWSGRVLDTAVQGIFRVRMQGIDNGQVRADTTAELAVEAVTKTNLDFDSFQTDVGVQQPVRVSVDQDFKITAIVLNRGQADVDGLGQITLDLGSTGITTTDPLTQNFTPGVSVEWNVTAPSVPTSAANLTAQVTATPDDENTNLKAALSPTSRTISIATGDVGTVNVDTVRITSPVGAVNGIVSTEQDFFVRADVRWQRVINGIAQIELPSGYNPEAGEFTKDLTSGSGQQSVQWRIFAPTNAQPLQYIKITAQGDDESSGSPVLSTPDSVAITTVLKAQLVFDAQIAGPDNALNGEVTVGQEFTVRADLSNAGTAGVSGDDSVAILLPSSYSTSDNLTQLISAGGSVTWTIKAPDNPTGIEVITIEIPAGEHQSRDQNSDALASLTPNPARITIPVQTLAVGLNVTLIDNIKPTTIVRGETDTPIFGLDFENSSNTDVDLEMISLTVKDGSGNEIAPNSVLTRLTAAELGGSTVYGTVSSVPASNKVDVAFSPPLRIVSSQMASVAFRVDVAAQTDESAFSLSIESPQQDILARDIGSGDFVLILDSLGVSMDTPQTAGISVFIDPGLEDSFFNYPNPFGRSDRPNTAFSYNLQQDSDVSLRIYTLVGQLVWEVSFAANSPEGRAGRHAGEILWDGKNGENRSVLNGVYVAVLTTSAGQAITKIAIAK